MSKALDLGRNTAGKLDAQDSLTDVTVDRLMKVGAFGLGARKVQLDSVNVDDIITGGLYGCNDVAGSPLGDFQDGLLEVVARSALDAKQIWTQKNLERVYIRWLKGGTWSPWREVYSQNNILGTVSQSAGVPTGAIIERGSNANGEYTKFADGTLICIGVSDELTTNTVSGVVQGVTLYESNGNQWSFPSSFSSTPAVFYQSDQSSALRMESFVTYGITNTKAIYGACSMISLVTSRILAGSLVAIGRWY